MRYLRITVSCYSVFLMALICLANVRAESLDEAQVWPAGQGQMTLELRGDYLPDFGLELFHEGRPVTARTTLDFPVEPLVALRIHAPWGHLESLDQTSGRLQVQTGLSLHHGSRQLSLDPLFLVPGEDRGHPLIIAVDAHDRVLFRMSHLHIRTDGERGRLLIANAEVEASRYLADTLDLPALVDLPIAVGWLDLALDIPDGAIINGAPPGCDQRPIWPQSGEPADVTLIDMAGIAYQGKEPATGRLKLAPSARLKNESQADIPWFKQFTNPASYPYEPSDQHPFLVWNVYRIDSRRIRMLASSGAKHAFFATNQNCDLNCGGGGQILWPGCEDTYSSGNNDTSTYQAPRDEIEASLGLWESCGSFFDPGCSGVQTGFAGQWNHRLLIDPVEFDDLQPGTLYMDAWYLIQSDINIWNSMGFRSFDPQPDDDAWTMNPGPFQQGPVISEWLAEDEAGPMQAHSVIEVPSATPGEPYPGNLPQGHLRLLVKVFPVGPGRYRYHYAIQNYDFDHGLEGFRIALPENVQVFSTWFGDLDEEAGNDWTTTVTDDQILFTAPPGNALNWGMLFNFEIEIDTLPIESPVALDLGPGASAPEIAVQTLAPGTEAGLVFHDRFESTP